MMSRLNGQKTTSSSVSAIANDQHHDQTGSQKNLSGTPGALKSIITPTAKVALDSYSILRVVNGDVAVQYIWIGKDGDEPLTLDASNSFLLPINYVEIFHCPVSDDDKKSIVVKTSSANVQVAIIET